MLELGVSGNIAKPLKKRTIGATNIKDVYDGANHIWPPRNDTIYLYDFDSVQLRYIWGVQDGWDFDTGTFYVNAPTTVDGNVNNKRVGWSQSNPSNLVNGPYMYWGGDNTLSGAECVMVNVRALKDRGTTPFPEELLVKLLGNWYGSKVSGYVTIECSAFKGGTIVKAYQLRNAETSIGMTYLFVDKDGFIDMPDKNINGALIKCWYGATFTIDGSVCRINMINDSIVGHSEYNVNRNLSSIPSSLGTYTYSDGYVIVTSGGTLTKYKIWNDQVNIEGKIYKVPISNASYNGVTIDASYKLLVDSTGDLYSDSYTSSSPTMLFGFVAGNSEFKGTKTILCYVNSSNSSAAAENIGSMFYYDSSESGQIIIINPVE